MLNYRYANENDVDLFFRWANDKVTRKNSYNNNFIMYFDHENWFKKRIVSEDYVFYVFMNEKQEPVGQVRFEKKIDEKKAIISISIDLHHRGKGYSFEMLKKATENFLLNNIGFKIIANIIKTNQVSYHCFKKAGYEYIGESSINSIPSYILFYL